MIARPLPSPRNIAGLHPQALITCALIAAAVVLGGGGSTAPGSELALQLVFAAGIVAWSLAGGRAAPRPSPTAWTLAGLMLVLPILQLLPLPPMLWRALSGRGREAAVLDAIGAGSAWMPWTISAPRTLAALLATIPAAAMVCLASCLDRRGRIAAMGTVAIGGVASLLLGALQLADGAGRSWRFYRDNQGFLNGFQANRNAEADLLLIAALALSAVMASRSVNSKRHAAITLAGVAALLLGCALTGSRAGIALMLPAALLAAWPWRARLRRLRGRTIAAALALGLVLAVVLGEARGLALRGVAARFTWQRDVRLDLWRDTWPALRAVWPAGSGIGTFRPLFIAFEPLSSVDPTRPVRAHNDYLELALEGGLVALGLLATGLAIIGRLLLRGVRCAAPGDRPTLAFVVGTIIVLGLHSLVDYPMRSMALAVMGALVIGMLCAIVRDSRTARTDGGHGAVDGGKG